MSEEILKALTRLFAIITKQDGGVTDKERLYVIHFFQTELDHGTIESYVKLYDEYSGYGKEDTGEKSRLTSVSDSVKTLGICKMINQTLTQKQKVVVLIKLLELVGGGTHLSPQRKDIINTVASVFNIDSAEFEHIQGFVNADDPEALNIREVLIINSGALSCDQCRHFHGQIDGSLLFLRIRSVDMYFVKYIGSEANLLNGFVMERNHLYLFTHGSIIKSQAGDAFYYSDLVAHFNDQLKTARLSFNATVGEVKYSSGHYGLHDIRISEGPGKLIGIMGASGAGKTTLLKVLAGLIRPDKADIRINGLDLHTERERLHGVIGFVSQDDLLIEELTVYQNLYYNAKLCFADLSEAALHKRVMDILHNLGLDQRKDLRIGNNLERNISGGQRKRLNIALELIREPAILFLDEPTSGLSSRDSENVIDLLKEMSIKGKLIFVVIHQPSSDIYKMFDKMIIMDTGGYPAYYGPPVEAITYFKKSSHQADNKHGQCQACGDVALEQIFNIMEARVVDEYGQPTTKRKVTPQQWYELYKERFKIEPIPDVREQPPRALRLPNKFRQTVIFAVRDTLAKLSNNQYLLINLLEAPLLAILLAYLIRYNSGPGGKEYVFRYNENFPAFILMGVVVALFMGLTVSAEEIIRDRKILKRESFLHLSWNSYLLSKLVILFSLSAIQTFSFVLIGHLLLAIEWKMLLPFWFVLFSLSCMANVMGLNISSVFRSAVAVYITIPLLLIPQLILSGVIFRFDKLNDVVSTRGKVPLVADLMASRWGYEAMAVFYFTNNSYQQPFYALDKATSTANFRATYLADELDKRLAFVSRHRNERSDSIAREVQKNLDVLRYHIGREAAYVPLATIAEDEWKLTGFTPDVGREIENWLTGYKRYYQTIHNKAVAARDEIIDRMERETGPEGNMTSRKNRFYNQSLADLLTNITEENRIVEYEGRLVQQIDPVFQDPQPEGALDYRAHFFAPTKNLLGMMVSTYWFNLFVIWMMAALLYTVLSLKLPAKMIGFSRRNASSTRGEK